MIEVPSAADRIVIVGDYAGFTPEALFDHFTVPELLLRWWPKEADVDPREGGEYHFGWPAMDWHLRGAFTAFDRGRHLGFTWAWDHGLKGYDPLTVDIFFHGTTDGTRIGLFHGPFAASGADAEADAEARQGIVEGWIHFGMVLAGLASADSPATGAAG